MRVRISSQAKICVGEFDFTPRSIIRLRMAKDYQSRVIQLMRDLGLKQKAFGDRVGATQPTVSRWIRGAYPEPDQAERIDALWNETYGAAGPAGGGEGAANAPSAPTSSLDTQSIGTIRSQALEEKRLLQIAAGIFQVAAEYCERVIPESLFPHLGAWALNIVLGKEVPLPDRVEAAPEKSQTESEDRTSSKIGPSSKEEH